MRERSCSVPECQRPHAARGWCGIHYNRWLRGGDVLAPVVPRTRPAEERFFEKVDAEGDCWRWVGATLKNGYGYFGDAGKSHLAHRWSWTHLVGPISDGLHIDHLCKNRRCVNPDHMQPVTPGENVRRGWAGWVTGAKNRAKTHCPGGHEYTAENTYVSRSGRRHCRSCTRVQDRTRKRMYRERERSAVTADG